MTWAVDLSSLTTWLTCPSVMLMPIPSGLPTAMTLSRASILSESPREAAGNCLCPEIFMMAMSSAAL